MAAEAGHHPNLPYFDQATGALHLNGATVYDSNETPMVSQGNNGIGQKNYYRATYDFSVDGGAVGLITPAGAVTTLPAKAVVTNGWTHVTTAVTSGGSPTVAFGLESTNDLLAATAIATMGSAGFHALIPIGTAATFVQTTVATRKPTLTVATAALTAGKILIVLEYVVTA